MILELALASWFLVYLLCFSWVAEGLRQRLGVEYEVFEDGHRDRWGYGAGRIVNCPSCLGLPATALVLFIWWLGLDWMVHFLAVAGAVGLVARWWMSTRPKAEWWI